MADGASDGQERTEKPTARKLARAREQGQVAKSQDLSGAVVLVAGTLLLAGVGGRAFADLSRRVLVESWGALSFSARDFGGDGAVGILRGVAGQALGVWLGFAAAVALFAILCGFVQLRGFVLASGPITPKLSHVNPLDGLKRVVSLDSVVTLLRSIVKLALIGAVTFVLVKQMIPSLLSLPEAGPADTLVVMGRLAIRFGLILGGAYVLVGVADYLWNHFRTEKNLRMSRQEVLTELRETEGNPLIKARLIGMARALARRRMLNKVPTADVVVVNPTHVAVALKYDPSRSPAPLVLAMGQRKIAERIREIATKAGVPLVENRPVARALLATARVGFPIPPALYAAVAEILAFVYRRRRAAGLPALAGAAASGLPARRLSAAAGSLTRDAGVSPRRPNHRKAS